MNTKKKFYIKRARDFSHQTIIVMYVTVLSDTFKEAITEHSRDDFMRERKFKIIKLVKLRDDDEFFYWNEREIGEASL